MESGEQFFGDIWATLEGVFRTHLSPETCEFWQKDLQHLPRHSVILALQQICKNEYKMPSLALFLRYCRQNMPQLSVPKHRIGKDKDGVPCWFFEDEPNSPKYLARDCKEGREFLATFASLVASKPGRKKELIFQRMLNAGDIL
jgi:hypothetical protein